MAPKCGGWCACICPMNKRMAEDRKRDIRDEVEFRQAQLNAQAQRLRGTVHMYMRDARMFVEQRDDTVARKMLIQKAMMEQRIAVMATHWSVLESVRVSLQPSEVRCVGDLVTCRTILNKTGLEFIEPVRLEALCPTPHVPRPSTLSRVASAVGRSCDARAITRSGTSMRRQSTWSCESCRSSSCHERRRLPWATGSQQAEITGTTSGRVLRPSRICSARRRTAGQESQHPQGWRTSSARSSRPITMRLEARLCLRRSSRRPLVPTHSSSTTQSPISVPPLDRR